MNGGRLTQITRRLFRLAVSDLCLLSLLACVGAGALAQDDRVEAVAIAVAYWSAQLAADVDRQVQASRDRARDQALREFARHALVEGAEKAQKRRRKGRRKEDASRFQAQKRGRISFS